MVKFMKSILSQRANFAKLTYGNSLKKFTQTTQSATKKYLTTPISQTSKSFHTHTKWQANYKQQSYYISSTDLKYLLGGTTVIGFVAYYKSPNQKLYRAIQEEDVDKVKGAIEAGADINNSFMPFGRSPLHNAAAKGNANIVEYLINAGANVNQQDEMWKSTPLMSAILAKATGSWSRQIAKTIDHSIPAFVSNHDTVIRLLISNNADCNIKNDSGVSPFHALAATNSDQELIKLFINHGADLESKDKDLWTPLHWAAFFGLGQTCKTLIDAGAEIDAQDINGHTPLYHLLKSIKLDIEAREMLINKPNPNNFDMHISRMLVLIENYDKEILETSTPPTISFLSICKRMFDFFLQGKNIIFPFSKWAIEEDTISEKGKIASLFPDSLTQINQYFAKQEEIIKPAGQDSNKPTTTDIDY